MNYKPNNQGLKFGRAKQTIGAWREHNSDHLQESSLTLQIIFHSHLNKNRSLYLFTLQ
jgi:hypothetical protein